MWASGDPGARFSFGPRGKRNFSGISAFTVKWPDLFRAAFLDEKLRGDPLVPLNQK
jgi:hypothetical protein